MDRRGFLKRLGLALGLAPLAPLAKFLPTPKPDLRQLSFTIKEELGYMVFNPTGVQRLLVQGRFRAS